MFFVVSSIVLLLAYVPNFFGAFFIVDDTALIEIPQLQLPFSWKLIQTLLKPGIHVDYYPIRDFSYWIDLHLLGARSDGANSYIFRIQNFVLFLGIGLAINIFLNYLTRNRFSSLFFAFLWLLNPFHFEMVWWISARKDLLALFFFSWSAILWIRFQKEDKNWLGFFSLTLFILSLLSKTTFLLVPVALLFMRLIKGNFDRKIIPLALGAIICALWGSIQNWQYTVVNDMRFYYPVSYRIQSSITALGRMLMGVFYWPINSVDLFNWGEWLDLNRSFLPIGCLYWLSIAIGFVVSLRKNDFLLNSIILFVACYLPVSGLTFPHRNFYSARYFEGALLVLIVFASLALNRLFELYNSRKNIFRFLGMGVCLWSFAGLILESNNWDSNRAILEKSLRVTPGNIASQVLLLEEVTNLQRQHQGQLQDKTLLTRTERELYTQCLPYLRQKIEKSSTLCSVFFSHVSALIEEKKKVPGEMGWAIYNDWLESLYAYRTHTPIQEVMDKNWARRVLYGDERRPPPKQPSFFSKEKQRLEWAKAIEKFNSFGETKSF